MKADKLSECNTGGEIDKLYLINVSDCILDKDKLVRIKRKYGKFKRPIIELKDGLKT